MTNVEYLTVAKAMYDRGFMPVANWNRWDVISMYHVDNGLSDDEMDMQAREIKAVLSIIYMKYPNESVPKLRYARVSNDVWISNAKKCFAEFGVDEQQAESVISAVLREMGVQLC